MHTQALVHLRAADPRLAAVIDRVGACGFEPRAEGTHFGAVARAIVYQQLSGKAAGTIHRRFHDLYGGREPTPTELLETPDERLRGVGLSRQKSSYLKDLAARVVAGEVPIETLETLPDDAIVEALVRVKGVGRWTAQMFLMFRLGRPDVLPDLDLGVQKGLQLAHGLATLPAPRDVARLGACWAPYRTIASWYLWRLLDNGDGQAGTLQPAAATAAPTTGAAQPSVARRAPTKKKATPKKATPKKATPKKPPARSASKRASTLTSTRTSKQTAATKTTGRKRPR